MEGAIWGRQASLIPLPAGGASKRAQPRPLPPSATHNLGSMMGLGGVAEGRRGVCYWRLGLPQPRQAACTALPPKSNLWVSLWLEGTLP